MSLMPSNQGRYPQGRQYENSTDLSSFKVWNEFFLLAGIPTNVAGEYAVTFSQHRVRIDMLKEITKEILLDMGIKAMGDIIAILRHAKNLSAQDELKFGLGIKPDPRLDILAGDGRADLAHTKKTAASHQHNPTAASSNHKQTNVTSASNLSASGTKIQSRVSSKSGALKASSESTTANNLSKVNQNSSGKRPSSSSISDSLAKRLCPAPRITSSKSSSVAHLTEKTLTVHYPPSYAKALAQAQTRLANPNSIVPHTTSSSDNVGTIPTRGSIKSRIGDIVRSGQSSSNNSKSSSRPESLNSKPYSAAVKMQRNSSTSFHARNPNHDIDMRKKISDRRTNSSTSRDHNHNHHNGRSKSNVFDRLGNNER